MHSRSRNLILLLLILISTATNATAYRFVDGSIVAIPAPPGGAEWEYQLTINWDTGGSWDNWPDDNIYGFSLIMDQSGSMCTCQEFEDALSWQYYIGWSNGPQGCGAVYYGDINCNSSGTNLTLSGREMCLPAVAGEGYFVIYSDLPPVPVDEERLSLVTICVDGSRIYGYLSGVFPAFACDPIDTENRSFGSVKRLYR